MKWKSFIWLVLFSAGSWLIVYLNLQPIVAFFKSHGILFLNEDMPRSAQLFHQTDAERLLEKFSGAVIISIVLMLFATLVTQAGRIRLRDVLVPSFEGVESRWNFTIFRFLFCVGTAYFILGNGGALPQGPYNPTPIFQFLHLPLISVSAFWLLHKFLIVSLIFGAFGLLGSLPLHGAWMMFFIYQGTRLGFSKSELSNYVYHSENLVPLVLLVMAFASPLKSADWAPKWPLQSIRALTAIAYFGAGYCKVITSPLWADGYTLQAYLAEKFLYRDNQMGLFIASHWELSFALSVLTLMFELFFFYCVFIPKLRWWFLVMGIGFHTSIFYSMDINFLRVFSLVYLAFVPWGYIMSLTKTRHVAPDSEPYRWTAGGIAALALVLTMALCIPLRWEAWPFSDFRVFQDRFRIENVEVYRLGIEKSKDQVQWLSSKQLLVSRTTVHNWLWRWQLSGLSDPELIGKSLQLVDPQLMLPSSPPVVLVRRTIEFDQKHRLWRITDLQVGDKRPRTLKPVALQSIR